MIAADDDFVSPGRRAVIFAVLRALLTAAVLVALYYLMPLDGRDTAAATVVKLTLGVVVFAGLMAWQVRAITESDTPGLRALEGMFVAVPLFLVSFASTYFMMSRADVSNFTSPLTRTDALYFTVTTFSTVGFGDITARSGTARLVVTGQIMLDLVILGLGVRIILDAVQRGRSRLTSETGADPAP